MRRIYLFTTIFNVIFFISGKTQNIQVHYLGHSAFVLKFDDITVVSDYGKPNAWKEWGWDSPIYDIGNIVPDIMTFSHTHDDHYDSTRIPEGVKFVLIHGDSLVYKDLKITPIKTCEDHFGDFMNTSYLFTYKGYNILHTGDIQIMIANIENDTIKNYFKYNYPLKVDLLIMPVEGKIKYIEQAEKFIQFVHPNIVIPAHFWTLDYLNSFLDYTNSKNEESTKYNVLKESESILKLNPNNSDNTINIYVLTAGPYKR